jgi:aminoglycoside phosphotransferase (APT) family kinase protein
VPDVVALDTSKTLASYDYLILTKVPGKTVNASLAELTPEMLHEIAYRAGEYLATMHSYALDGFGLLFELAAGIAPTDWTAYVTNFYQDYGGQVRKSGALSGETLDRIEAVMEKIKPLLASVERGRFVHGDYHFSNILQQDGHITGVIDFEWAMSGDPAWDFRIDDQLEAACPGNREAFYAGYTSRRALTEGHWERVSFYRIGLYLDYLATFQEESEQDSTIPSLMKELAWLEERL